MRTTSSRVRDSRARPKRSPRSARRRSALGRQRRARRRSRVDRDGTRDGHEPRRHDRVGSASRRPRDRARRCAIVDALARVHAAGFAHRDLKPDNIVRRADGSLVILDLGLARKLPDDPDDPTRAGVQVGSVEYMAPEQAARRDHRRRDRRHLRVRLHPLRAVRGRPPFVGDAAALERCARRAPATAARRARAGAGGDSINSCTTASRSNHRGAPQRRDRARPVRTCGRDGQDRGGVARRGRRHDRAQCVAGADRPRRDAARCDELRLVGVEFAQLEADVLKRLREATGKDAPAKLRFAVGSCPSSVRRTTIAAIESCRSPVPRSSARPKNSPPKSTTKNCGKWSRKRPLRASPGAVMTARSDTL